MLSGRRLEYVQLSGHQFLVVHEALGFRQCVLWRQFSDKLVSVVLVNEFRVVSAFLSGECYQSVLYIANSQDFKVVYNSCEQCLLSQISFNGLGLLSFEPQRILMDLFLDNLHEEILACFQDSSLEPERLGRAIWVMNMTSSSRNFRLTFLNFLQMAFINFK